MKKVKESDRRRNMRDIKNQTILCCGVDGENFKLVPGKYSIYYRCPKYELVNRVENEKVCTNCISLNDAQLIYAELEMLAGKGELKVGSFGRKLHLSYEIFEVTEDYIKVLVINLKKIKLD